MSACKSTKKAVDSAPGTYSSQTSSTSTPKAEVERLISSYNDWSDVSMSVKCRLKSPKNMTVSGKATMIRDKEIQISLRMLGFEVAGVYINRDSVFVYEKLNRTMIAEPLSLITNATGITLGDIQNILLGQLCYPGQGAPNSKMLKNFNIETSADGIVMSTKTQRIPWSYTLASENPPYPLSLNVDLEAKGAIACRYTAPLTTEAGPVSPSASLNAKIGKQTFDGTFEWSLETASWNKGLSPSAKTPTGYRRISAQQLLKMLSGL